MVGAFRLVLGAEGERERNYDFLNSIEVGGLFYHKKVIVVLNINLCENFEAITIFFFFL